MIYFQLEVELVQVSRIAYVVSCVLLISDPRELQVVHVQRAVVSVNPDWAFQT